MQAYECRRIDALYGGSARALCRFDISKLPSCLGSAELAHLFVQILCAERSRLAFTLLHAALLL